MTVDELTDYGMVWMNNEEIRGFLLSQGMGVLGLSSEDAPYLLPMSFGFDGESQLYFTYVLGASSRKAELSSQGNIARFLVYSADTSFMWESVLLTGTLSEVPENEWDDVRDAMDIAWRPELFKTASMTEDVKVYRFLIKEQSGIKHMGLPPEFESDASESNRS